MCGEWKGNFFSKNFNERKNKISDKILKNGGKKWKKWRKKIRKEWDESKKVEKIFQIRLSEGIY